MKEPTGTSGKPVTLTDVGRACGLAPSTVSNALNGTGTTSERTRKMVREAARKLGYRPNVHAATLAHRSLLLAWFREHRPDCIVAFNTAPYYMLEYCGVNMAKEAGFLSYALSQYDARESCFSGFWAERFDVARECLERLLFLVTRSRKGVSEQRRTIIVDPVFNEGATLRATTSRRA